MIALGTIIKPIPVFNRNGKKIGMAEGNLRAALAVQASVNRIAEQIEAEQELQLQLQSRYPIVAGGSLDVTSAFVRQAADWWGRGTRRADQPLKNWKYNRLAPH